MTLIRKATIRDKKGITNVLKASYNIATLEEGEEAFERELGKGFHYIVAEEAGKIVGLVTWNMHGLPKHGLVELDRIAVLPSHKGKGIAKQLFDGLVQDSKAFMVKNKSKLRKVYLLTHDSNARAHGFYEKLGMKHETTLKSHYYDKEDERVYSIFF